MPDPGSPSHYVHGTDPGEQQRLATLNRLLNDSSLAEMRLCGGERILDLGSGLGQFTRAMARVAGSTGHVVGVERSAEQIAAAARMADADGEGGLIEQRQGNADRLPLTDQEWGSFDLAHARFVLEHLPDPAPVVASMVAAVRPGGRIILEDDDHAQLTIWPEVPGFMGLWEAYVAAYRRAGNDPFIGRRLVSLLHAAGGRVVRSTMLFFGAGAGEKTFPAVAENFVAILRGARAQIVEEGGLAGDVFASTMERFTDWVGRPDAALWYTRSWAEAQRPENAKT
ncbi:MAG: methyltransferase domain-containing protein [Acidobacteriota bacterium]